MEIKILYRKGSILLVGLSEDYIESTVNDGLVLRIDIEKGTIVDGPWSGQQIIKYGYYESVLDNEQREFTDFIQEKFSREQIFEMVDLLLNPTREAVDSLIWIPDRLKNITFSNKKVINEDIRQKNILYIDMDNVLVDFQTGIDQLDEATQKEFDGRMDEVPGIFGLMSPMKDAVESFNELSKVFDIYILSTAPWENPSAWSDKLLWVKKYLGKSAYKRLILTHHKDLNSGDYLVDDREKNGAGEFKGEFIHFGQKNFPDWKSVKDYLLDIK